MVSGCCGRPESCDRGGGPPRTAAGRQDRRAGSEYGPRPARRRCRGLTERSLHGRSALTLGIQIVHLALERFEILEALVDAGEADVGDLVERSELVHRELPYLRRINLRNPAGAELGLDLVGGLLGRDDRCRTT